MAVNYTKLADTALRLVQDSGRDMTFRRLNRTPADVAKPWRGATAPRATAGLDTSVTAKAVVVPPGQSSTLGFLAEDSELVKRSEQILLVALGSTSTVDLSTYDEVLDGATLWKIDLVQILKPGGTVLLFAVGVKR